MPSYTIFPTNDADISSTSATYATARDGTGGLIYGGTGDFLSAGQWFSSPTYYCLESFFKFDTSGVAGAVLSAGLVLDQIDTNPTKTIEARERAWVGSSAAWVAGGSLSGYPLIGSLSMDAVIGTKTISLSQITKAASYGLMLNGSDHRLNVAPTVDEKKLFHSSEYTFGGRPYLSITTNASTSFGAIL